MMFSVTINACVRNILCTPACMLNIILYPFLQGGKRGIKKKKKKKKRREDQSHLVV